MEQPIGSGIARVNDIRADDGVHAGTPFSGKSAASWPAIFAGAFVAVAITLVLVALGSGVGFASVSPWPGHGASAAAFTVTTAIWLIVTQWLSAALGGYIAGRLRTKWVGTHTHEVFFRDTAHGFITWSVATVFVAAVLAGSVSSMVGGGLRALSGAASAGAHMAGPAGQTAGPPGSGEMAGPEAMPGPPSAALTYEIDKLFRPSPGAGASMGTGAGAGTAGGPGAAMSAGASGNPSGTMDTDSDPRVEAVYIAYHAMTTGSVPDADKSYLADRVVSTAGVSQSEAQRRVDAFITETQTAETHARAAADKARKAAAEASIYLALSMLVGAFIASISAALGGRLRDEHI